MQRHHIRLLPICVSLTLVPCNVQMLCLITLRVCSLPFGRAGVPCGRLGARLPAESVMASGDAASGAMSSTISCPRKRRVPTTLDHTAQRTIKSRWVLVPCGAVAARGRTAALARLSLPVLDPHFAVPSWFVAAPRAAIGLGTFDFSYIGIQGPVADVLDAFKSYLCGSKCPLVAPRPPKSQLCPAGT